MEICPTAPVSEYNAKQVLLVVTAILFVFSLYPLASLMLHNEYYGMSTSRNAPQYELKNAQGNTITSSDFSGQHVYLMFGYLGCADVCHTQALRLESLSRILNRDDIQFVYLAMDSKADQPSALRNYFDQRGDNFTSLHADSLVEMQSLAGDFNAGFRIKGNPNSDNYTIEHPTAMFLVDPEGQLRLVYRGQTIDEYKVAEDFNRLYSTPVLEKS